MCGRLSLNPQAEVDKLMEDAAAKLPIEVDLEAESVFRANGEVFPRPHSHSPKGS